MSTSLIAAGTTEAESAEFTLAEDESASLYLVPASGKRTVPVQALIRIEYKNAAGEWSHKMDLFGTNGSGVVTSAGTFRAYRPVQTFAVGIERG